MERALTDYFSPDGRYLGFDVGRELVEWCQSEITVRFPAFVFVHADVQNDLYNPDGLIPSEQFRFPCADESVDLVLLESVFTHLFPPAIEHYTKECARVLLPGGHVLGQPPPHGRGRSASGRGRHNSFQFCKKLRAGHHARPRRAKQDQL